MGVQCGGACVLRRFGQGTFMEKTNQSLNATAPPSTLTQWSDACLSQTLCEEQVRFFRLLVRMQCTVASGCWTSQRQVSEIALHKKTSRGDRAGRGTFTRHPREMGHQLGRRERRRG